MNREQHLVDQKIPLSICQERYLDLHRSNPDSYADNMPYIFHIQGKLNLYALEQSLTEIQRRHSILRTIYSNATPYYQIVLPSTGFDFSLVDLCQEKATVDWQERVTNAWKKPFDLTKNTPLRCTVFQLKEQEYILSLTIHHIAYDFHSENIFFREFEILYAGFSEGVKTQTNTVNFQYKDFAIWQRQHRNSEAWFYKIQWWLKHLAAEPPTTTIPGDIPMPVSKGIADHYIQQALPLELVNNLHAFCKQNKVSLFVLLFSVFNLLIHKMTGETDIVIGVPLSTRNSLDLERAIGVFAHNVALRTNLSGISTLTQLLKMTTNTVLSALKHRDVPVYSLPELMPARNFKSNPFYKIRFNLLNIFYDKLQLLGTKMEEIPIIPANNPDFGIAIRNAGTKGIKIDWNYDAGLYTKECVENWTIQYQSLLEKMLNQPDAQLKN